MKKILPAVFIIIITLIALYLRINKISSIPPSLSWDEVSIGYNAYSILKTGHDEHGRFFPVDTFVAYGDYKPPLAIYLTVPSIAAFGLNELGIRLPSAVFGTLTVLLTFFLVRELFIKSKNNYQLSMITSALLAISPWHINLSRAGFEANIAVFFIVLGIYFMLRARERTHYWYFAWVPFVASVYTFNSARYVAPLFALVLFIFCINDIKKHGKRFISGVVIAIILLLPIIPHLLSKEARLRFTEVNIFTDSAIVVTANDRISYDGNWVIGKILHNRRFGYALSYLRHFLDNLQPSFLFIEGDGNPKFSTRVMGELYVIEAPLLVIGIFSMVSFYPTTALFLLLWIMLAIVPAATARETPHALRILNSLPAWQIIVAFGISTVLKMKTNISKYNIIIRYAILCILLCGYGFGVGYYLHNYYSHYAEKYSGEWQYGYREAIRAAQKLESQYDIIYISSTIGRPYMYTLFYTKYDPNEFRQTKDDAFDQAGFYHVNGFGKYRFIDRMPAVGIQKNTLYVADPGWVPADARILKTITLLDGTARLVLFDKQ